MRLTFFLTIFLWFSILSFFFVLLWFWFVMNQLSLTIGKFSALTSVLTNSYAYSVCLFEKMHFFCGLFCMCLLFFCLLSFFIFEIILMFVSLFRCLYYLMWCRQNNVFVFRFVSVCINCWLRLFYLMFILSFAVYFLNCFTNASLNQT